MRPGHARKLGRMPSAMGVAARLAYAQARTNGLALRPLLRKSGLQPQELADTRTRLPVSRQIDFLNRVAEAMDDDMLGMNLALKLDPRRAGLFYYVLASSDTLIDALARGARFTSIVNEGVTQQVIRGRRIGVAMSYTGVRRQDDRHQIEFWLTTLVLICRQFTGTHLEPERVRLAHRRPALGSGIVRRDERRENGDQRHDHDDREAGHRGRPSAQAAPGPEERAFGRLDRRLGGEGECCAHARSLGLAKM